MIICKPYGAKFLRSDTCIAKQAELVDILKKNKEIDKRKPHNGADIRANSYAVRYFALKGCHGCKVGLGLYNKYKAEQRRNPYQKSSLSKKVKIKKRA